MEASVLCCHRLKGDSPVLPQTDRWQPSVTTDWQVYDRLTGNSRVATNWQVIAECCYRLTGDIPVLLETDRWHPKWQHRCCCNFQDGDNPVVSIVLPDTLKMAQYCYRQIHWRWPSIVKNRWQLVVESCIAIVWCQFSIEHCVTRDWW